MFRVSGIFLVEGVGTVFAGEFLENVQFVPPCQGDLLVDGKLHSVLPIGGEMLGARLYRAVWSPSEVGTNLDPLSSEVAVRVRLDPTE